MGMVTTVTIDGLSRADGTTTRTVTMQRVGNVTNGFILRESLIGQPNQQLAQSVTVRSTETPGAGGANNPTRNIQAHWVWPYEVSEAPGVVAGTITLNKTGLHIPANCPAVVRKDVRAQMTNMANIGAGTYGKAVISDALLNGDPPY